jgi:hypothetical protein
VADQQADKLVVLMATAVEAGLLVAVAVAVAIQLVGVGAAAQLDTQAAAATKTKDSMHTVLHLVEVNILQHTEQAVAVGLDF